MILSLLYLSWMHLVGYRVCLSSILLDNTKLLKFENSCINYYHLTPPHLELYIDVLKPTSTYYVFDLLVICFLTLHLSSLGR